MGSRIRRADSFRTGLSSSGCGENEGSHAEWPALSAGPALARADGTAFSSGEAFLGLPGEDLLFCASMCDEQPFNRAARRNELAWVMGDVVELFLRKDGEDDYYEFHVTPENKRLQLHFPDDTVWNSGAPLKSWMVEKDLFESFTQIDLLRASWEVILRIDLASLFGQVPSHLHFLVGLYDAQPRQSEPVISCSGQITECSFHRLHEWSKVEILPPD